MLEWYFDFFKLHIGNTLKRETCCCKIQTKRHIFNLKSSTLEKNALTINLPIILFLQKKANEQFLNKIN